MKAGLPEQNPEELMNAFQHERDLSDKTGRGAGSRTQRIEALRHAEVGHDNLSLTSDTK